MNIHLNIKEWLAIASFTMGSIISIVCLCFIPPLGEIASSAISIVSEFLVLCGALLGISASFDNKLKQFETTILKKEKEQ